MDIFFFSFNGLTLTVTVALSDLNFIFELGYICKGFGK